MCVHVTTGVCLCAELTCVSLLLSFFVPLPVAVPDWPHRPAQPIRSVRQHRGLRARASFTAAAEPHTHTHTHSLYTVAHYTNTCRHTLCKHTDGQTELPLRQEGDTMASRCANTHAHTICHLTPTPHPLHTHTNTHSPCSACSRQPPLPTGSFILKELSQAGFILVDLWCPTVFSDSCLSHWSNALSPDRF